MKPREIIVTLVALLAIGSVIYLARHYQQGPKREACAFCERPVHRETAYRVSFDDKMKVACCPRCGMHYAVSHPGAAREAIMATDMNSGGPVPAQQAYYVEGGDVEYCTTHETPVQRAPQSVSVRAYDRCLPTLVAFLTARDAEAYRRQHGGRVLTYDQALESVKLSLP